jgi:CTP synthase
MDYLYPSDEGKTKPIQHAVTLLRSYGLQPDILIVRCKRPITKEEQEKISLFTGVPVSRVIAAQDADSLYEIPAALEANGMTKAVLECFPGLTPTNGKVHREDWAAMLKKCSEQKGELKIGLVGKYIDHSDAYLSVIEAVHHAGIAHKVHTKIVPINSEDANVAEQVQEVDAIIIPGGFGNRGIEGKITAISTARKNKIPFMGICLGLQTAVIEFARNNANLKEATSTEFDEKTPHPVVAFLPGQEGLRRKGGTMRLGSYAAVLSKGSLAEEIYKQYRPQELKGQEITERHRHRYEVNPEYHEALTKAGLIISGMSPDGQLAEFIELPRTVHPYFIATQAHPEFRSRPNAPHPLFAGLIAAALK